MRQVQVHEFGVAEIPGVPGSRQQCYLSKYLGELGAKTVVVEPLYFDQDYLEQFAAFYATSARRYPNHCGRFHFFDNEFNKNRLIDALSGESTAVSFLQKDYLGFAVQRPLPSAPLGRTVLRWYPEQFPKNPRNTEPSRSYQVHLAGLALTVTGLAWQQQDSGVAACATIALWSMLQSSALDEGHAVPSTATITSYANNRVALGARVYPSEGLTIYQVLEAIKECGLDPIATSGDLGAARGFSRIRFSTVCASLVRSGFPVLLVGDLNGEQHAVCMVGFREAVPRNTPGGEVLQQDADIPYVYLHDDNFGPAVRFEITQSQGQVVLRPSSPTHYGSGKGESEDEISYPDFVPQRIVAAVDQNIRLTPDELIARGLEDAGFLATALSESFPKEAGFSITTKFSSCSNYLTKELPQRLGSTSLLGRVRLAIHEEAPPLSLHVGIIRILSKDRIVADFLMDTTDVTQSHRTLCQIVYEENVARLIERVRAALPEALQAEKLVEAW